MPTLEIEPGDALSENAAILQFVAERFPEARLAPAGPRARARLQQWLSFIGTELHKALYLPLLDEKAPAAVKAYALTKADSRLSLVARWLEDREFLLDQFSVADAYLFAVLNWSQVVPVDLKAWPALVRYQKRLQVRPSIARAFAEELEKYQAELARDRTGLPATGAPISGQ